ncbi:hypothetical protein TSTA_003280 [Talaromyces stipitatus ATCC 10500]|uniref:Uncharacterized protein n=1 Tax=Talaromyces stipitatus (strain ATCC 10500 / CBS 375.48 / QM 6759 / NRRL 1006) TaxID=441959 RepID=B8MT85_TALSN|nr:uncharacterized protein TSTA_003280 [Talaromyces stipitatus ATCC 10500]EED12268.1 hypothetical protein TSTA_003280 [Talaromyces stipitatus ATCC 10500]
MLLVAPINFGIQIGMDKMKLIEKLWPVNDVKFPEKEARNGLKQHGGNFEILGRYTLYCDLCEDWADPTYDWIHGLGRFKAAVKTFRPELEAGANTSSSTNRDAPYPEGHSDSLKKSKWFTRAADMKERRQERDCESLGDGRCSIHG